MRRLQIRMQREDAMRAKKLKGPLVRRVATRDDMLLDVVEEMLKASRKEL